MSVSSSQEGESNASLQADELQALSSIYGAEWNVENATENSYSIDIAGDPSHSLHLKIILPPDYPLISPPRYQFSAPWMTREEKDLLSAGLQEICWCHVGESILYEWIEATREFIRKVTVNRLSEDSRTVKSKGVHNREELPPIHHGEPIEDRGSVFQAHLARVVTVDQVKRILAQLKENRKIDCASHNIVAYRICCESPKSLIQECNDDGENKGGSVLLHVLQILDARDVLVVVTRWRGAANLGPDRFEHISNAARMLLNQCGYTGNEKLQSKQGKVQKKKK